MMSTSFFNPPGLEANAGKAVTALLKLLGWIFATAGKKATPFGPTCRALGIVFNLGKSNAGTARYISGPNARRLHGRMVFADAQLFGTTGKRCMSELSRCSQKNKNALSADDCFFLSLFLRNVAKREAASHS